MPTAEKAQTIDELTTKLRDSKGAVILDYRGLNVADISALRRQLAAEQVEFHVAKNTLLRIAADRAQVEIEPELLTGPTAIAFGWENEVTPARLLSEYVRRSRIVSLKGGIIGGRSINAEAVNRVADLPPRDQLLAQLLGGMNAPLAQTLGLVQAQARKMAGLFEALREQKAGAEAA
jgi:large subunit ribosomal protein L10